MGRGGVQQSAMVPVCNQTNGGHSAFEHRLLPGVVVHTVHHEQSRYPLSACQPAVLTGEEAAAEELRALLTSSELLLGPNPVSLTALTHPLARSLHSLTVTHPLADKAPKPSGCSSAVMAPAQAPRGTATFM